MICEDDKKANLLLDKSPKSLRKLVVVKEVRPATHQRAKNRGVEIVKYTDVELLGAQKDFPQMASKLLTNFVFYFFTSIMVIN